MNGISARWMVSWILAGTVWGAQTSEIPDRLPLEFRQAAIGNMNFSIHVGILVDQLLEIYQTAHRSLGRTELYDPECSLKISAFPTMLCSSRDFQVGICLNRIRNMLRRYHMYLTSEVVERNFPKYFLRLYRTQHKIDALKLGIEDLLRDIPFNPVATRMEQPRQTFENDFLESVYVNFILKQLRALLKMSALILSHIGKDM